MVGAVRTPELSGLMAPRRRRRFCTNVPEQLSDLPVGSFIVDRRGRRTIAGALGLLALIGGGSVGLADSLDARLAGAWAPSAADCAKLFQRRGGALTFRQPIDKFAQAEIIGPQTILAPSSSCRVQSVSRENGAIKVNAACNDSISFRQDSVWIKVQPSGEIVYSPTGNPALGTTLIKCAM
jgi:hypothetical protein